MYQYIQSIMYAEGDFLSLKLMYIQSISKKVTLSSSSSNGLMHSLASVRIGCVVTMLSGLYYRRLLI